MARQSKVEACMLCGELPCACNKPAKKKVVRTARIAKNEGDRAGLVGCESRQSPSSPPPLLSVDQVLFQGAIRALGPLLAPEEREQYAAILTTEPTTAERSLLWRARRDS